MIDHVFRFKLLFSFQPILRLPLKMEENTSVATYNEIKVWFFIFKFHIPKVNIFKRFVMDWKHFSRLWQFSI